MTKTVTTREGVYGTHQNLQHKSHLIQQYKFIIKNLTLPCQLE